MMLFTFPSINAAIGDKAFDLQPLGYNYAFTQHAIAAMDDNIKTLYLWPQLLFLDVLYPPLLGLLLVTLMNRLLLINQLGSKFTLIYLLPLSCVVFDYAENIMIISWLTQAMSVTDLSVILASLFTILKGVTTTISWGIIILLFARWTTKRLSIKFSRP